MKQIFILIISLLIPYSLLSQLIRSGSLSSETWNQNVHITADATIGSGITITISPGITVELASGVSLYVTGSGILSADASSGSSITFTALDGTSWGHLVFKNTSASVNSTLKYCTIEKGDCRLLSPSWGGGIDIESNNVEVENCTLSSNKAYLGGGIHISESSVTIKNCKIDSNYASGGGGGIHLYVKNTSKIINCLITNNSVDPVTGDYCGGGILLGYDCYAAKVINCTFANNSSTGGSDVNFSGSYSLPKFTNCILWSNNPVRYADQVPSSTDFTNCAIIGSDASIYTNCIDLNSSNSHPEGPNFYSTSGTDWSIKVISPCRDAGTTPNPAVPTDYANKSRIGNYDIGAYEVRYNSWKTDASSTTWATESNWNNGIVPDDTQNVIIPSGATNYPTGSATQDFTIGTGKGMILEPGALVTLGTLTKTGDLKLQSDASNISSLITNNSVSATIELFLTGGGTTTDYKWHYISTPVSTLPVTTFTGVTKDIVTYAEPRVSTDLAQGWIGYDGWIYSSETPAYDFNYDFTALTPGNGYDYWDQLDNKFTFSGSLNVSNQAMALSYSGTANSGFNLLGNPFPSGLDWNEILTSSDFTYPPNTSEGIYFTRAKKQCSYIGGVGIPADVTGIIPPMQGFFVKTYSTGNTINLSPAARTHTNIHPRYKGIGTIPLVRLSISEAALSDETVIRFDEKAKTDLDYNFDALKVFDPSTNVGIYSLMGGQKYAINGQPFPDPLIEIPVAVNIAAAGNHTITSTQLQGLDNYDVYLVDNSTGFTVNLKTTQALSFSAVPGLITDRFILKVGNIITGNEDPVVQTGIFNIYSSFGNITIQTIADEWIGKTGSVRILDLAGRTVTDLRNTLFSRNSVTQIQSPGTAGIYVVEIRSGVMRYIGKLIIK
jgi:hypothetical protein